MFGRTARTYRKGNEISGSLDRWMTYQEAATLFGSTPDAVRVRAHRSHWRRQRGNDGKTLVLVPVDPSERPHPPAPEQGEHAPACTPVRSGVQHVQNEQGEELRLALELLRDQAAEHYRERHKAEKREQALRAEVQSLNGRVAEAEAAALDGWRTAAELARQQRALMDAQKPVQALEPSSWGREWLTRLFG